jgi:hypothetical protein
MKVQFLQDDPNNCRKYFRGEDGKLYATVEGVMHACTDEGEPMYPVTVEVAQ